MKIVIDARMLYWTGVGRYTQALLANLEAIDRKNQYTVLMRHADWSLWKPTSPNFRRLAVDINPYTFAEQLKLAFLLFKLRPDLVHFTAPNTPLLYSGKKIVTVHDLTLLTHNTSRYTGWRQWLVGLKRLPFRLVLWNDTRTASQIISTTSYVRDQILERYTLKTEQITVVPLAAERQAAEPEKLNALKPSDQFLLYVGNYYPYKNVTTLIDAFSKIASEHSELKLVLGGKPDSFVAALKAKAANLQLTDRIIFAGYVTNGQLAELYNTATIFVNPSLSEGFGLQGLEAMMHGLPVVSAEASCLPEVYGDAAVYFDPLSASDLAEKLSGLLANRKQRETLIRAGRKHSGHFSWHKTAEATLKVYESVIKS